MYIPKALPYFQKSIKSHDTNMADDAMRQQHQQSEQQDDGSPTTDTYTSNCSVHSPLLINSLPQNDWSVSQISVENSVTSMTEPTSVYKSRWLSIRVMYLTMFLSSLSFSICLSSIWPYLKLLDAKATTDFLGWVVAAYSIGQLIASPLFGFLANCRRSSREPLIITIIISFFGNIAYAYMQDVPSDRKYYLLGARALVGFGAGNVAVVRSYVSGATAIKERTAVLANISAAQAIGFVFGPAIQTALVVIGYPGVVEKTYFHLNMYTAPAFLSSILASVNLILVLAVFREHQVYNGRLSEHTSVQESSSTSEQTQLLPILSPDTSAVVSCNYIFFVVLFMFSIFETIATPLSMDMFDWTKSEATLYTGIMLAVAGLIAIITFMGVKFLSKIFDERLILCVGFILCFLGFVAFLPWGNNYPDIKPDVIFTNTTTKFPVTSSSKPIVGCAATFEWCRYTPKIYLSQFVAGTFLIAMGYPICSVITYTIYSKVLGPRPQGTHMGWITASGSLARTLGPIFVSNIYVFFGTRVSFGVISGIIFVTIIVILIVYKKLVPFGGRRVIIGRCISEEQSVNN